MVFTLNVRPVFVTSNVVLHFRLGGTFMNAGLKLGGKPIRYFW